MTIRRSTPKLLWVALLALGLVTEAPASSAQSRPPVVKTRLGQVSGVRQHQSEAYLGIPFAQPPVGPLRWRPPQPPASWRGVRDGSHFSANCYQAHAGAFGPFTSEFNPDGPVSEDCLYLNVWKPTGTARALPVLVFIHGGGFSGGSGSVPIYNGARLAAKGAVVITINYRVGAFGFLAHPLLTAESPLRTSGNYGLLDVIAALRWVKANVSQFGGDPSNVTLAGQSAGAMAVNDLLLSPEAKGLFAAAIAESGTAAGWPAPSLVEAEANGLEIAREAGAANLDQLRALPASRVLELSGAGPPVSGQPPRLIYLPTVDGKVLTASPNDPKAPISVNVPLMTGWNRDEAAGMDGRASRTSPAKFERSVREVYGSFADQVLAAYPHADEADATRSAEALPTDLIMANLALWAQTRSAASGEPVYVYQFGHAYPGPQAEKYGTFHTAEVPYVFGVLDQQGRPFTNQDRAISEQLQAYWIGFMRTHRPGAPGRPSFPRIAEGTPKIMHLGDDLGPAPATSTLDRLTVLKAFIASQPPLRFL